MKITNRIIRYPLIRNDHPFPPNNTFSNRKSKGTLQTIEHRGQIGYGSADPEDEKREAQKLAIKAADRQ
jgi:hypothetical protein